MIGKIRKGSGFKGCVDYVLGRQQAVLLHADGYWRKAGRTLSAASARKPP